MMKRTLRSKASTGKFDTVVLTSTFPRHTADSAGCFLADLCGTIPLRFLVVCPTDPELGPLDIANTERRVFRNAGIFYGAGAIENLRTKGIRPVALFITVMSMLWTGLRAARHSRVIWSHWALPAGFVGSLCRMILGRRHVLLLHSADVWLMESIPGGRWLARFISSQTDELFAVSPELVERFAALCGRRGQVLGCGVTDNVLSTRPNARPRVGMMSRLVPSKRVVPLSRLAHTINGELHIAGDGPEADELKQHCEKDRQIVWHGSLAGEDKLRFLADLDVFAAPYGYTKWGQSEGLPTTVLEAMTASCPVVAFCSAVPAGLIENGVNGLVVADGDFAAMICAINELLSNPLQRRDLGAAARASVRSHRLDLVAASWHRILAT